MTSLTRNITWYQFGDDPEKICHHCFHDFGIQAQLCCIENNNVENLIVESFAFIYVIYWTRPTYVKTHTYFIPLINRYVKSLTDNISISLLYYTVIDLWIIFYWVIITMCVCMCVLYYYILRYLFVTFSEL